MQRALILPLVCASAAMFTSRADAQPVARVVANDNRVPGGWLSAGTLRVSLEAREARWRPEGPNGPEVATYAFAEAGKAPRIPGPLLRAPVGTEVLATVRNRLPKPLRIYGLHSRPAPGVDSIDVEPGGVREMRFRLGAAGTYLYWARTMVDTFRVGQYADGPLSGAIVVDSLGQAVDPRERIFVITLWKAGVTPPGTPVEEREETVLFNGVAWPHNEKLRYTVGDTVRWRVVNATRRMHPTHLHGFYYLVTARGTAAADTTYAERDRRLVVTEALRDASTMSMVWVPHTPGNWLFHCHNIEHIATRVRLHQAHAGHEMAGLVLGIQVRPRKGDTWPTAPRPEQSVRLIATERPRAYGDRTAYSFIAQDDSREPASDSIRAPSSPIVLTRGVPAAITVVNRTRAEVAVHWHGIELESYFDGVGNWSGDARRIMKPIVPGDSFIARMTPPRAGTFIYHTHQDESRQMSGGMYGALIVTEPGVPYDTATNRIVILSSAGWRGERAAINGDTIARPIELRAGVKYRFRIISIAPQDNKMIRLLSDTTQLRWRQLAKDGAELPVHHAIEKPARLLMGVGETADFEIVSTEPRTLTLSVLTSGRGLAPTRMDVPLIVRP